MTTTTKIWARLETEIMEKYGLVVVPSCQRQQWLMKDELKEKEE